VRISPLETGSWKRALQSRWGSNIMLLVLAYVVYLLLRYSVLEDVRATAFANADAVIAFEKSLGIFHEAAIQGWMLENARWVVLGFNWFYTLGFFPVILPIAILLFLVWPKTFTYYRDVFLISLVLTWTLYALFPLAPPRMIPSEGFVDAMVLLGPDIYTSRESQSFYNAYSAMPSMHFGWPLLYGVMLFRTRRPWLRAMAVTYPTLLFIAVIVTGNHYFLDPIVGALVIIASFRLRSFLFGRANQMRARGLQPEI
jgi:hypothetical protein